MFFLQYAQIYPKLLTSVNGSPILVGSMHQKYLNESVSLGELLSEYYDDFNFIKVETLSDIRGRNSLFIVLDEVFLF